MTIDVSVKRSPGWWLQREFNLLASTDRQARLIDLHNRRMGNPPLPVGAENAREAFDAYQRKARSNFAELISSALAERTRPVGFRTAADDDETGDAEVGAMWRRAGMEVTSVDVHDKVFSLSEGYVVVGAYNPEIGAPDVTNEDPRIIIGEPDPARPRELLAALKMVHDDAEGEDRAYLYLPGRLTNTGRAQVWVARRDIGMGDYVPIHYAPTVGGVYGPGYTAGYAPALAMGFDPQGWSWDFSRSGELDHPLIPVVRFENKDCVGEFETHIDLLDRINHQILQRMVIATMQAFRQRAVKGLPLRDPTTNEIIDYSQVFTADPAAIWQLPKTAEMWESGQVDLSGILSASKDDINQLSAVTRTPLSMMMPGGVNQSAEGASLQREGLIFKARDRIARLSYPHAKVAALMLLQAGQRDRADLAKLETIWAPPEQLSLSERADAASKASADIPRRSRLIHIWNFPPAEADRMMSEWADEQLLQAQLTAAAVAAQQPPAGVVPGAGQVPGAPQPPAPGGPSGQGPPTPSPRRTPTAAVS